MKWTIIIAASLTLILSLAITCLAGNAQIDIRVVGDTIDYYSGDPPTLDIWIANDVRCREFAFPIEFSSPSGVFWTFASQASGWGPGQYVTHVFGSRIDPPEDIFDLGQGLLVVDSGVPAHLAIGGAVLLTQGMTPGPLQHMLSVHIDVEGFPVTLSTLCVNINSTAGPWTFSFADFMGYQMTTTFLDDNNDGVWCFPAWVPASAADETSSRIPETFGLGQNYPNPFNPSTVINYSMERKGKVDISIFNVLGQFVKTLVSGEVDAGAHQAIWDGTDRNGAPVASGIYSYRMVTDRYAETRKMTLVR
jgi:hypothetical protein